MSKERPAPTVGARVMYSRQWLNSCGYFTGHIPFAVGVVDPQHELTTRLLGEAARTGCQTINGLSMFVYQGAVQFELWTGEKAPLDVMKSAVESSLQRV